MTQPSTPRRSFDVTAVFLIVLILLCLVPLVQAQDTSAVPDKPCRLPSDTDISFHFNLRRWVNRGGCVRRQGYKTLNYVLEGMGKTREAEYAGAASVLALLPTIGALFGSPTSEIWRLKSIVPFGGVLAMSLSFGGALMPVHVEDYERTVREQNTAIGSIISLRKELAGGPKDGQTAHEKLEMVSRKIKERIDKHESVKVSKGLLLFGLFGMFVLFSMAQAAMAVVEQGGIINWLCGNNVWMHMWYLAVTITAYAEDRVNRPFKKTYKLYISSLPYDVEVFGGQPTTDYINEGTTSADALKQLRTLKPGSLNFLGSRLRTRPRNSVMVMVSIIGNKKVDQYWQVLSRCFSVTVFVSGTAIFASVTLLSLIMATVVLTLTLAAGIFGRAIASWIVGRVSGTEPMIHVITSDEKEACQAIASILNLKSKDGSPFQVEVHGVILINERRVATRSWLKVSLLGVLAEPYDLTKTADTTSIVSSGGMSLASLSKKPTNSTGSGASLPFLSNVGDPLLPTNSRDLGSLNGSISRQSIRSGADDDIYTWNNRIPERPTPVADLER